MANQSKRISELPSLSPASLDTTFVVGISGSTTYKISVNQLTSSLDITFATDLVTNALSSSLNGKLSTSSFNSYTASFTSSVASGTISGSSQLTSSFDIRYTLSGSVANVNTASLVSRLNAIENVSGSWITEIKTGSFLTSLSGAISSSSQLTSSYDIRYTLSGSILTAFSQSVDNRLDSLEAEISSSVSYVFVKHDGVQTAPATGQFYKPNYGAIGNIPYDVNTGYFTLYAGKTYNLKAVYSFYDDNSNESTHGWYDVTNNVYSVAYGNYPQPAAELIITPSTNIQVGIKSQVKIGNPTIDNSTSYVLIQELGIGIVQGITGSTDYTQITNKPTLISGSSQLTSSYDTRYTLSGSVQPLPSNLLSSSAQITAFGFISSSAAIPTGTISGSAQITSFGFVSGSYETTGRGIWSGSAQLPTGVVSGSAQLPTGVVSGSAQTILNLPTGTISGSSQLTSSYDGRYIQTGSFNTFTSSYNTWTSSLSAIGTLNVDYINAGRITSDQTGAGSGSDIIFNYAPVSSGISLNTSTGVFTLTANKTYKLFAELSFSNFSDTANGYEIYDWVDATTNTRLSTTGIGAGIGENINRNTNEFNATSTTLIYTPTTNQTIKVRIVEAAGTVTVRAGIGTKAIIEEINPSVALNQFSTLQVSGSLITTGSITSLGGITGSIAATNGVISGSTQLTTAFPSKTTGAWSVPAGASTQSFSVESGASYTIWVNGNIPNGIITWNATVTTANTNVPAVGSQYGWYYTPGNALVLTTMPDQIIGTNGSIANTPTSYAPNTSNVFKFGITNNSGTTQTINYGYIKLS